jgi:hypothetical protein
MLYSVLGFTNIALLAVMTSPFWLRFLNERFFHKKGGSYAKAIKILRALHRPLGAVIIVIAAIHGYLALGTIRLHTGVLVFLALLVTATLGGSFFLFKKKPLFLWHRRMVLVVLLLLLIHLLFPNALYYLL